jgi:F-type H+-transporting ATPase subunit a
MSSTHSVQAIEIEINNHVVFGGINVDTVWATVVAGAVVIILGLLVARRATSGVPSGMQLFWESVVAQVQEQVEQSIGMRVAPFTVPIAVTIFVFVLACNWLEIIPTHGALPSPTADVNLTFALALVVIVWVHWFGVKRRGAKEYFGHFFKPWYLAPINIIEEIAKPITLALRLFGNIFSSAIMLSLIALFPAFLLWLPNAVYKLFDMAIGIIQAFIFALLTILYFSFAGASNQEDH